MRFKTLPVALFGALLAVAGCSSSAGNTPAQESGTLTVWLMNGSAPQSVVDGVNADFNAKHPNVKVDVQIQQWSDVTTKLDTAYAGSTPPDVVELGNTLVAKYAAAGALEDISGKKGSFEGSASWLQSLTESCTFGGKLYCVPYYAGSRAVIYRKDMFTAAGITNTPASTDELLTDGQKLMTANASDSNFSALYFPGKYWYAAAPFVWDFGGDIATQSGGQWKGSLDSSQAQQGLTSLKGIVDKLSRADKTGDELKQDQAFAQGHIAMIVANGWEVGVITDPKAGDPSLKDKLAALKSISVAVKFQTQMATVGQVIPNNTTLLDLNANNPLLGTFAAAAKNSRFVPNSPNWANVESANVLQDMLVSIFTGKQTIPAATSAASSQISTILNAKS